MEPRKIQEYQPKCDASHFHKVEKLPINMPHWEKHVLQQI
jgi:hypothetical protein